MANPPKQRGTLAESAVVKLAHAYGLTAERRALAGSADQGDVWIDKGKLVLEIKSRRGWWTWTEIDKWYREALRESEQSTYCDAAVLVVKRPGYGPARAGDWFAWITVGDLTFISTQLKSSIRRSGAEDQRVMLPLGDLLALYKEGQR